MSPVEARMPGPDRRALAHVVGLQDDADAALAVHLAEDVARPVLRAVVDDHDLALEPAEVDGLDARDDLADRRLLVVGGHDDRTASRALFLQLPEDDGVSHPFLRERSPALPSGRGGGARSPLARRASPWKAVASGPQHGGTRTRRRRPGGAGRAASKTGPSARSTRDPRRRSTRSSSRPPPPCDLSRAARRPRSCPQSRFESFSHALRSPDRRAAALKNESSCG
jgi:hypothetical protein